MGASRKRARLSNRARTHLGAHRLRRHQGHPCTCTRELMGMERKTMRSHPLLAAPLSSPVLAASGGAGGPIGAPPDVPAPLRPPAGESLFLEALASGVQIYEC